MTEVSFAEIEKFTLDNRLSFETGEIRIAKDYMKKYQNKGYNLTLPIEAFGNLKELAYSGFLPLRASELDIDLLYVKINAGKGILGRQKSVFQVYIGSFALDEFTPGTTYKMWAVAITSIGNLYRHFESTSISVANRLLNTEISG